LPGFDTANQSVNRLRLIAGRLKRGLEIEHHE
jgi:hypothetical protein